MTERHLVEQQHLDGFALGVVLALVSFALGLVLWIAAVRTEPQRVDVRRWAPYLTDTSPTQEHP